MICERPFNVLKSKYYVSMNQPHDNKDNICGPNSYTLVLDDSLNSPQFSIDTDNNDIQEDIYFTFIGIDITSSVEINDIVPKSRGGRVSKNHPQSKTPKQYETGVGDGGSSTKTR